MKKKISRKYNAENKVWAYINWVLFLTQHLFILTIDLNLFVTENTVLPSTQKVTVLPLCPNLRFWTVLSPICCRGQWKTNSPCLVHQLLTRCTTFVSRTRTSCIPSFSWCFPVKLCYLLSYIITLKHPLSPTYR